MYKSKTNLLVSAKYHIVNLEKYNEFKKNYENFIFIQYNNNDNELILICIFVKMAQYHQSLIRSESHLINLPSQPN
jgi:hypothetical protein